MNTLDASVASQSETSRRSETRYSSEGVVSRVLDPFFDFMTLFIQPHFLFYLVYIIVLSIQIIYTSMWIHATTFWVHIGDDKKTKSFSMLARIIHYIAPFSPIYHGPEDYLLPFVVFSAFVFFVIVFLIFQLAFYKTQRRFSKYLLYPTRVCVELFVPLLLVPIAHITGHSFFYITESGTKKEIQMYFYFVLGVIEFIVCISIFFYSASLIGVSAYISNSPIGVFDHKPYIYLVLSSSIFTIFETCFLRFKSWIIHPLVVAHIFFGIIIARLLIYQPFISMKWNCYFLIIDIFSILLDAVKLISNFFNFFDMFKDKENGNLTILIINIIVFFVLLIVSIVVSIVYSYLRYKKMYTILTTFPDGVINFSLNNATVSEEYRTDIFKQLKVDRSEASALSVLYFILQNCIVQYLDFTMIKFILNSHKSVKALMQCMRSISYFPQNSRHLNMLFNLFMKRRDTKFTHRFFIFQIQKIKMLRQSSSSLIACEKLHELTERTKEIEEDIIDFWLINPNADNKDRCKIVNDHGVDVTYLYKLQDRVSKTRSLWNEALIDYPNSISYRTEFCHFAIECQTNFTDAIKNKHKIGLIESGKNFNVDMTFRLFVRAFPNYLKKISLIQKATSFVLQRNKEVKMVQQHLHLIIRNKVYSLLKRR